MSQDWLKPLAELLGKGGVTGFTLGVTSGALLMAPNLTPPEWRPIFWVGCMGGFSLGVISCVDDLIKRSRLKSEKRDEEAKTKRAEETKIKEEQAKVEKRHDRLKRLSYEERAILQPYLFNETRSIVHRFLQSECGHRDELVRIGVLAKLREPLPPDPKSPNVIACEYLIEDWAYEFLRSDAKLTACTLAEHRIAAAERSKQNAV
jgi:hypothetical protein